MRPSICRTGCEAPAPPRSVARAAPSALACQARSPAGRAPVPPRSLACLGTDWRENKRHYRKPEHCRVPRSLPSTIFRALGKQPICQVPSRKHSAKKGTRQTRLFAECLEVGTRQRGVCRVPRGGHSANIPFLNFLKILKIANKV